MARIIIDGNEPVELELPNGMVLTIQAGSLKARQTVYATAEKPQSAAKASGKGRKKRVFSPEAKARLAEAARRRWAKAKRQGKKTL